LQCVEKFIPCKKLPLGKKSSTTSKSVFAILIYFPPQSVARVIATLPERWIKVFLLQTYQVAVAIFPAREAHHRQSRQRQLQSNTQHFIYIYKSESARVEPYIAMAFYLPQDPRPCLRFPRKRPQPTPTRLPSSYFFLHHSQAAKSCERALSGEPARVQRVVVQERAAVRRTTMGICAQVYSDQMEISLHSCRERRVTIMGLNRCFRAASWKGKALHTFNQHSIFISMDALVLIFCSTFLSSKGK
jgi:hypothetical protein